MIPRRAISAGSGRFTCSAHSACDFIHNDFDDCVNHHIRCLLHLGRDGTALPLERAIRALNADATRQVAMVAYIDDFELMIIIIVALLLLLLLRRPRRPGPAAAAGD